MIVHQPVLFETSRTTPAWIGDYVGLTATDGKLYLAYSDNDGGAAHTAFYRTSVP